MVLEKNDRKGVLFSLLFIKELLSFVFDKG